MTQQYQSICVSKREYVCINCVYYRLYHCRGDGNVWSWQPTSHGCCILHDEQRGPLRQPCKDFEAKK